MSKQTIRDNGNRVIGYVDERNDGMKSIRDTMNREIGRYNPRTDTTNVNGRPMMKGDFSIGLLGMNIKK
jgi:hypothetical protein